MNEDFRCIAVGVDYSDPSACALEEACRIAGARDSCLVVAHVLPDEALAAIKRCTGWDDEAILAARRMRLDRFCLESIGVAHVPSLTLEVIVGHPFIELMRLVEREGVDLLVLGAQGESHRQRTATGTVVAQCARMAPCAVLLVRAAQHNGFRRVVVAIDFSDASRRALRRAAAVVKADGGELHVLHVFAPAWKVSAVESGETRVSDAQVKGYVENVERRLADFLLDELDDFGGLAAKIEIRESFSAGGGIVAYLNEVGADLVVLGARGREPRDLPALGTTAELIVHDAPCSILTVQPEGRAFHAAAAEPAKRCA